MGIFTKGSVVQSLAGRDGGRLFIVLEIRENYALIADGKFRRLEKPKLKKLKHLRVVSAEDLSEKPTNTDLRRLIEKYKEENPEEFSNESKTENKNKKEE